MLSHLQYSYMCSSELSHIGTLDLKVSLFKIAESYMVVQRKDKIKQALRSSCCDKYPKVVVISYAYLYIDLCRAYSCKHKL